MRRCSIDPVAAFQRYTACPSATANTCNFFRVHVSYSSVSYQFSYANVYYSSVRHTPVCWVCHDQKPERCKRTRSTPHQPAFGAGSEVYPHPVREGIRNNCPFQENDYYTQTVFATPVPRVKLQLLVGEPRRQYYRHRTESMYSNDHAS